MKQDFQILKSIQEELLNDISLDFKRNIFDNIERENKMIWLIWERWIWKTTIMLQKMKTSWKWFYFSADNASIKINWLFKFVYFLYSEYDIKTFYIDEVHKYQDWTTEIKNIYDSIPKWKVVFSWSSSLDLYKWILDLARRVDFYKIYPLNFSEFLKLFYNINVPSFTLDEILQNHKNICLDNFTKIKNRHFEEYLNFWYYPFSKNISEWNFIKVIQNLLDKIIIDNLVFTTIKILNFFGYITFEYGHTFGIDGSNGVYIGTPCNGLELMALFLQYQQHLF